MLHGAGIFTYIWAILGVNLSKYSIHGASGIGDFPLLCLITGGIDLRERFSSQCHRPGHGAMALLAFACHEMP